MFALSRAESSSGQEEALIFLVGDNFLGESGSAPRGTACVPRGPSADCSDIEALLKARKSYSDAVRAKTSAGSSDQSAEPIA